MADSFPQSAPGRPPLRPPTAPGVLATEQVWKPVSPRRTRPPAGRELVDLRPLPRGRTCATIPGSRSPVPPGPRARPLDTRLTSEPPTRNPLRPARVERRVLGPPPRSPPSPRAAHRPGPPCARLEPLACVFGGRVPSAAPAPTASARRPGTAPAGPVAAHWPTPMPCRCPLAATGPRPAPSGRAPSVRGSRRVRGSQAGSGRAFTSPFSARCLAPG